MKIQKNISRDDPFSICFVCLGNICRSPTAEGVFQHLVNERGLQSYFEIDSAGTSAYHIGEPANSKSQYTANQHGITLHSRARRFVSGDIDYFDLILAMDHENLANIKKLAPRNAGHLDHVMMLRAFDPEEEGEVPDPYSGGMDGFEKVFTIVERSCEHLLNILEQNIE